MAFGRADVDGDDAAIVAEINVTPLTDIFLVLLIIFMVTSTALTNQGSKVDLPRADAGAGEATGVVVTATAEGRLEVDGKPIKIDDLGGALTTAFQHGTSRNVILRGDRNIILEDAVELMSVAREAGAERLAIATTPPGK